MTWYCVFFGMHSWGHSPSYPFVVMLSPFPLNSKLGVLVCPQKPVIALMDEIGVIGYI